MTEFEEAVERIIAGPERKSRVISSREKEMTAYHEAGHALVAHMLPHADRVHKISIVSRGNMGGHTSLLPDEDRYLWTKNQFRDMLSVTMGGRVAEELIFDEVTTGASNDLERATKVALSMIKRYGMSSSLGPRTFGKVQELVFLGREISEERDYGDKVAEEIDDEVKVLVNGAYQVAQATPDRQQAQAGAAFRVPDRTRDHKRGQSCPAHRRWGTRTGPGNTGHPAGCSSLFTAAAASPRCPACADAVQQQRTAAGPGRLRRLIPTFPDLPIRYS